MKWPQEVKIFFFNVYCQHSNFQSLPKVSACTFPILAFFTHNTQDNKNQPRIHVQIIWQDSKHLGNKKNYRATDCEKLTNMKPENICYGSVKLIYIGECWSGKAEYHFFVRNTAILLATVHFVLALFTASIVSGFLPADNLTLPLAPED